MAEPLNLERLKTMAQRRGLTLPDQELDKLLPGILRARRQATELRELLAPADEPAGVFDAAKGKRG